MKVVTWTDIESILALKLPEIKSLNCDAVYGIPRGGLMTAINLSYKLDLPLILSLDEVLLYKKQNKKVLLCDEINDSGKTVQTYKQLTNFPAFTLFMREGTICISSIYGELVKSKEWLQFPWEI